MQFSFGEKAIINSRTAVLKKFIKHFATDKDVVIFEDDQEREFFAQSDEWADGVRRYEAAAATKGTSHVAKEMRQTEKDQYFINEQYLETFTEFQEANPLGTHLGSQTINRMSSQTMNSCAYSERVTMQSSVTDKLALFRSLFKGRSDVFAHGYKNKKGGISYSFVCKNIWNRDVCPKSMDPHVTCGGCKGRVYKPLDDKELYKHLRGKDDRFRDVIGLYVIDKTDKTSILVADFDGAGWQQEAIAYKKTANDLGIFTALERSRSGKGAHVWIFFEKPISPRTARNLGMLLVTRAMEKTNAVSFDAYDRLFPAQDSVTTDGLGSLVALPLQGWARRQGNSVFVDEHLQPYRDQWEFLSQVKKTSLSAVNAILTQSASEPLGILAFSRSTNGGTNSESKDIGSAQDKTATGAEAESIQNVLTNSTHAFAGNDELKRQFRVGASSNLNYLRHRSALTSEDVSPEVTIIRANQLYIAKEGISAYAQNRIRRLAAYSNSDFYRAQAMGQSVFGKPRIISLSQENERYIALPRGCEESLLKLLSSTSCKVKIEDRFNEVNPIRVSFKGKLKQSQQKAAEVILAYDHGILSAPTGFGKTVIASFLIGHLQVPTLVIVPNTALLKQWGSSLEQFLEINEELPVLFTKTGKPSRKKRSIIGQLGGGKNTLGGIVDVATFQSLIEKDELGEGVVKSAVNCYGLVIFDECHHAPAPQAALVVKNLCVRYLFGLSATPEREDARGKMVYLQFGPVRYKVTSKEQAKEQSFDRILVPRFTRIRINYGDKNAQGKNGLTLNQVMDQLDTNPVRNRLIVDDVIDALTSGKTPLVVSKRKAQAKTIANLLEERLAQNQEIRHPAQRKDSKIYLLTGEGTPKEKQQRLDEIDEKQKAESDTPVIVATGSYIGEGFDLPRLDALFLASPHSAERVITQYSGRLHRDYEGKRHAIVYDYVDATVPMLDRMYKKRLKTYAQLGYEIGPNLGYTVSSASVSAESFGKIMRAAESKATFRKDIDCSSQSIYIAAPYLHVGMIRYLGEALKNASLCGVEITCVIRESKSEEVKVGIAKQTEELEKLGCNVRLEQDAPWGLAVFDEEAVWYGTLPLLAFGKEEDCSLRILSREVAADLLEGYTMNRP